MKHLGDITKINGAEATPVNVIIGGSPCQDLSVAGKRAGLAGERSGLFMEQLRIIKEMRKADADRGRSGKDIRPRFMVWENVPGAFSSNKGADFGAVLQETIRVICEAPPVPMPNKGWPLAGCLYGEGGDWSVAWRVFDAQFWGVPQRRRRIALIADFGGLTAPEILFEREGVSGYYPQGRTPWETATRPAQASAGEAGGGSPPHRMSYCIQGNCIDRADTAGCNGKGWTEDVSYTLNTVDRPAVLRGGLTVAGFKARAGAEADIAYHLEQSPTLLAGNNDATVCIAIENHPNDSRVKFSANNTVQALTGRMGTGGGNTPMILNKVYALDRASFNQGANAQYNFEITDSGINSTLVAKGPSAVTVQEVIRRLTPLECERLQGFPDGWTQIGEVVDYDRYQEFDTDGNLTYEFVEALYAYMDENGKKKKTTDGARYKALGNSIAIPPWFYVLQKLSLCCGTDHNMASLFDGIGGFPLIWEMLNGTGSCLWASEIEDFPIAVTKVRFPEEVHT